MILFSDRRLAGEIRMEASFGEELAIGLVEAQEEEEIEDRDIKYSVSEVLI